MKKGDPAIHMLITFQQLQPAQLPFTSVHGACKDNCLRTLATTQVLSEPLETVRPLTSSAQNSMEFNL
jgi:hypothetical protein